MARLLKARNPRLSRAQSDLTAGQQVAQGQPKQEDNAEDAEEEEQDQSAGGAKGAFEKRPDLPAQPAAASGGSQEPDQFRRRWR